MCAHICACNMYMCHRVCRYQRTEDSLQEFCFHIESGGGLSLGSKGFYLLSQLAGPLLNFSPCGNCMYHLMVLVHVFLLTIDSEYLFMYLFVNWISSLLSICLIFSGLLKNFYDFFLGAEIEPRALSLLSMCCGTQPHPLTWSISKKWTASWVLQILYILWYTSFITYCFTDVRIIFLFSQRCILMSKFFS